MRQSNSCITSMFQVLVQVRRNMDAGRRDACLLDNGASISPKRGELWYPEEWDSYCSFAERVLIGLEVGGVFTGVLAERDVD